MISPGHSLWRAALDLGLSEHDSMLLVTEPPHRWDELLDTRMPLLISSRVGSWNDLCAELWESGCPLSRPIRLAQADGAVKELQWQDQRLAPEPPADDDWTLAIGWTHANEGWRTRLPLWGRRYLVTRAADQGQPLVERLQQLGAEAHATPTIAFVDPDDFRPWIQAVDRLRDFHWILFTSPNGVDYFIDRLCQSGLDLRVLGSCKFACIGPSTARTLAKHGLKADLVPSRFVAEGLLEALRTELGHDLTGLRFLLPRAQVARTVLPDRLREAGGEVLVAPVYKTVPPKLTSLNLGPHLDGPPRLLFTSSSTVTNWVEASAELGRGWPCFCIGPITAKTAQEQGLEVLGIADPYTIDGLVDLLVQVDGQSAQNLST